MFFFGLTGSTFDQARLRSAVSGATIIEMRHQLARGRRIFEQCSRAGEELLVTAKDAPGSAGSRNYFSWVRQRAAVPRAIGHLHLRCSYTEERRASAKRLFSLRTGTAPIPTGKFVSAPRPTPCESTYAGAISHQWRGSSTALWTSQRGSSHRALLSLRALRHPGSDLLLL